MDGRDASLHKSVFQANLLIRNAECYKRGVFMNQTSESIATRDDAACGSLTVQISMASPTASGRTVFRASVFRRGVAVTGSSIAIPPPAFTGKSLSAFNKPQIVSQVWREIACGGIVEGDHRNRCSCPATGCVGRQRSAIRQASDRVAADEGIFDKQVPSLIHNPLQTLIRCRIACKASGIEQFRPHCEHQKKPDGREFARHSCRWYVEQTIG